MFQNRQNLDRKIARQKSVLRFIYSWSSLQRRCKLSDSFWIHKIQDVWQVIIRCDLNIIFAWRDLSLFAGVYNQPTLWYFSLFLSPILLPTFRTQFYFYLLASLKISHTTINELGSRAPKDKHTSRGIAEFTARPMWIDIYGKKNTWEIFARGNQSVRIYDTISLSFSPLFLSFLLPIYT